jgi:hypothetical protein
MILANDINGQGGYGWTNIRNLATTSPAEAIQNADSFAFFGKVPHIIKYPFYN